MTSASRNSYDRRRRYRCCLTPTPVTAPARPLCSATGSAGESSGRARTASKARLRIAGIRQSAPVLPVVVQLGRDPSARAGVHSAYESDSARAGCCPARVWRRQALSRSWTRCQRLTRVHPRAQFRADRHARPSADDASVSRLANLSAWSHGVEGCCRGSHNASILSFWRAVPSSDAVSDGVRALAEEGFEARDVLEVFS